MSKAVDKTAGFLALGGDCFVQFHRNLCCFYIFGLVGWRICSRGGFNFGSWNSGNSEMKIPKYVKIRPKPWYKWLSINEWRKCRALERLDNWIFHCWLDPGKD